MGMDDELDAEFVSPFLCEFRMMGSVIIGHEQNPPDRILLADLFECLDDCLLDQPLFERNHALSG